MAGSSFELLTYQPSTLTYSSDHFFSYLTIHKGISPLLHENDILSLYNAPFHAEIHRTPEPLGRLAIFGYPRELPMC